MKNFIFSFKNKIKKSNPKAGFPINEIVYDILAMAAHLALQLLHLMDIQRCTYYQMHQPTDLNHSYTYMLEIH